MLFGRLGVERSADPDAPVHIYPYPQVCHRGVVRPSVLVLAVDMMAGFYAADGAGTDWVFTTDLSLRAPSHVIPERIETSGSLLRAGRSTVTSDVRMEVDGALFAYGQASFARVARRHGDPEQPDIHATPPELARPQLERSLFEEVGVEITDPAAGRAELVLRDDLRNPAGVMQGAIVSFLAETAAEALADHTLGGPQVVTEIDVRYLAMGRVGPMRAESEWIGPPAAGAIRVTLRDSGNRDRQTAAVLVRTVTASAV